MLCSAKQKITELEAAKAAMKVYSITTYELSGLLQLSLQESVWVEDSQVVACQKCQAEFSVAKCQVSVFFTYHMYPLHPLKFNISYYMILNVFSSLSILSILMSQFCCTC